MKTNKSKVLITATILALPLSGYAQTYFGVTVPVGNVASDIDNDGVLNTINKTSSGWTSVTSIGETTYTTNGLTLTYTTETYDDPYNHQRVIITNQSDLTSTGIILDRYLSTTLGKDNFNALNDHTGDWYFNALYLSQNFMPDTGEHFEIRSSIDGFASTLLYWNDSRSPFDPATYASPLLSHSGSLYTLNLSTFSQNTPIELRFYSWNDSVLASNDGRLDTFYGTSGAQNYTISYSLEAIPEPSSTFLIAISGSLALLRRKRAF